MARFMDTEITDKQAWYRVDGPCGTEVIPADVVGTIEGFEHDGELAPIHESLRDYCENRQAWTVELIQGYGVRESASGYMDCTPWSVYETAKEARAAAKEIDAEYEEDEDNA